MYKNKLFYSILIGACITQITACSVFKSKKTINEPEVETKPTTVITPKIEEMKQYEPTGKTDAFLLQLLQKDAFITDIINKPKEYNVQILYTKIDRNSTNEPSFTTYAINADPKFYFYPASMVKMPVAILALQKINELKLQGKDIDKNLTMLTQAATALQTEVYNDPTTIDGRPTIAHYIKKIFLYSDNDAFNRLYEFVGQDYINANMQKLGYKNVEILHRLSTALSLDENKLTNPIQFLDSNGAKAYFQPAQKANNKYAKRNETRGKGYYSNGKLINKPFDFSLKNKFSLTDMHDVVKNVVFYHNIEENKRFNITDDDRKFLLQYMSQLPSETDYPSNEDAKNWDSYVKFNLLGSQKNTPVPNGLRIFNKVGFAYGYITDAGYIVDFNTGTEFLLSVTIHVNKDGIFNDDKYETNEIALPFMKKVGAIIYDYEKNRKKQLPNLDDLKLIYDK
jgi:predicted SprT family Zn-dependent metalloprotease